MPTTRNFASTYSGDAIRSYILKALIGGETLSTAGLSILTGVKFKRAIKKLTSVGIVQEGSCDFTPAGSIVITEHILEPKKIKVNEQICFEDVYDLWDAETMAEGMNAEQMPAELVDAVLAEFTGQFAVEVEEAVWQGNSAGTGSTLSDLIDGYQKILADDAGTIDVSGTVLTTANILTELNKVYSAIPAGVRKKGIANLVIFANYKSAAIYRQNLSAQGDNDSANEPVLRLYGIEIKEVGGLPDDVMVAGERSNFYFATDAMSDWADIKLLDQRDIDGSEFVNFVMKAKADVNIGFRNEVVYYTA